MKEIIVKELSKHLSLSKENISKMLEVPPSSDLGDFAFPCFILAKEMRKNPVQIAQDIAKKITSRDFEKIEAKGPYINFFLSKKEMAEDTLNEILNKKDKYGSSDIGKGEKIVIDMSSPNIAKPFGIGHLRSTIIGNSIAELYKKQGYKTIKINYLGDWGTQFGKMIVGYKRFLDKEKLKKDPVKHMLDLYVKANAEEFESESREWFKKLESGDKEAAKLWKMFRSLSLEEFNRLYKLMEINFDVTSGESMYNEKMESTILELRKKNLLKQSDRAQGVDLEEYGLGFCLIKKNDGATLYATRDLTAAIDRHKKYKFSKMIYEVGQEQKLHFQQVFKILELLGYAWAKECFHVYHGLYLDSDGKKFATREGKTVFMEDIFDKTISLARAEILKREKISGKILQERARKIALAAIFYGDLKNHRTNDVVFDIERFISFEGDTGPYLLYTYARSQSILRKSKFKKAGKLISSNISDKEKALIVALNRFPETVANATKSMAPNIIANYSFDLAQKFNEFYHSDKVIGSEEEQFRLALVASFAQVLKNSLSLLGISTIEKM